MGQSSSTEQGVLPELREVQSLAASTGALPSLQKSFSILSHPQTHSIPVPSLQKCFDLTSTDVGSDQDLVSKELPLFFTHLGSTIVDLFFVSDKEEVNLIEFSRGFTKCCSRSAASNLLNNLFRVFSTTCSKAGIQVDLQFELLDDDYKLGGSLSLSHSRMLVCVCVGFFRGIRGRRERRGRGNAAYQMSPIWYCLLLRLVVKEIKNGTFGILVYRIPASNFPPESSIVG